MARHGRHRVAVCMALLIGCAAAARAQDGATVAALEGAPEIVSGATARAAAIGGALAVGEVVRTPAGARVQLLLADGSVVLLGPDGELALTAVQASPPEGRLRMQRGTMRALVTAAEGRDFAVDTTTGVVRVRGTDFLIVADPVADTSRVVGFGGSVAVHSVLDPEARGVVVAPGDMTEVARGRYPTPPQKLTETVFRQYLDSLRFVGGGKAESLALADPLLTAGDVPAGDEIAAAAQTAAGDFGVRSVASAPYPEALIDEMFRNSSVADVPSEGVVGDVGVEF